MYICIANFKSKIYLCTLIDHIVVSSSSLIKAVTVYSNHSICDHYALDWTLDASGSHRSKKNKPFDVYVF